MLSLPVRPSWVAPQRSIQRVAAYPARCPRRLLADPLPARGGRATGIVARLAVVAFVLVWPFMAKAVEHTLSAAVLVDRCRGHASTTPSADGPLCESYLRGYLAGARSGGWLSFHAEGEPQETFSERASRTRLGTATRSPKPQSCLPDGTTLRDVVSALMAYAQRRPSLENVSAQQLLEDMLRTTFPCSRGQP